MAGAFGSVSHLPFHLEPLGVAPPASLCRKASGSHSASTASAAAACLPSWQRPELSLAVGKVAAIAKPAVAVEPPATA